MPTPPCPVVYRNIALNLRSSDELPKNVAVVLNQGSSVMSMDFHPFQPTLLLVGTNVGGIAVWEVSCRERLAHRTFRVRELAACSMLLQSALVKDPSISVNRVLWIPDGSQFGVAFSQHLVHMYNYNGCDDLIPRLAIDAHVGGVNDIAFSQPNNKFCVVTCGDDKLIKVWDAITGVLQYTFEGHEAPVCSICPHSKENIQYIFSTSLDGKIKSWMYDNRGSRVDYTAPAHWCTTVAYSADGRRLFSCATSKEGNSYIVEWNASEGSVKQTYAGLRKRSPGVVQFDTTKNCFLAAGDEFLVKFWDMDYTNLLTTTDAGGELPASPCFRFNKLGSLLAVSTCDNSLKILANADGYQMLRTLGSRPDNGSRSISVVITKAPTVSPLGTVNATAGTSASGPDRGAPVTSIVGLQTGDNRSSGDVKSSQQTTDETITKSETCKLTEINESSQCCSVKLTDNSLPVKAYPSGFRALPLFIPIYDLLEVDMTEQQLSCFSPFEDESYLLSTPRLNSMFTLWVGPLGNSNGWLVLLVETVRLVLLNPFSNVMIHIPIKPPCEINSGDFISALSPPPNYVAYFVRSRSCIRLFRCDDTSWIVLPFPHELAVAPCTVRTSTGELYLLSSCWDLFVVYPFIPIVQKLDMDKTHLPQPSDEIYPSIPLLMESNGDVLLVLKVKDSSPYPLKAGCRVFKADLANKIWVRLDSLGDRVLFLHSLECTSFSAADVGHGVKGNCVYFSKAPWEVFDLDKGEESLRMAHFHTVGLVLIV